MKIRKKVFGLMLLVAGMLAAFPVSAMAAYKGYTISSGNTQVYSNTALTSKYGTIYGSDEVTILTYQDNQYVKVTYPISGGRTKTGYIRFDAIMTASSGYNYKALAKTTTYRRPGGYSYGYVSPGDTVLVLGSRGDYTQIYYPAGSTYKLAFVTNSDLNSKIIGGGGNTTTTKTYYVTTPAGLILRSSASTLSSKLLTMPYRAAFSVSSISGGWAYGTYNGRKGYASMQYLSETQPQENNTTEQAVKARIDLIRNGSLKYNSSTVMQQGKRFTGTRSNEQCKGFAKNVFYLLFKVNISSTRSKPNNYLLNSGSGYTLARSASGLTATSAKNLFSGARPGDFIQIRRSHGGSHSAIVYSVSSSGVTFFEANTDGKNTVMLNTYSWSTLASKNAAMARYTARDYKLK